MLSKQVERGRKKETEKKVAKTNGSDDELSNDGTIDLIWSSSHELDEKSLSTDEQSIVDLILEEEDIKEKVEEGKEVTCMINRNEMEGREEQATNTSNNFRSQPPEPPRSVFPNFIIEILFKIFDW